MVAEVVRALARRWYVVVVGLLLTFGLVLGAMRSSPPEYHARGLVLLLPSESAVGKGGNPFLLLSGLEQPAGILVAYFSSAPAQAEVKALSPTAQYQVAIDDSTRGPVISVDVTATSPAETLNTLHHLIDRVGGELSGLQRGIDTPADARVGSMALTVDQKAQTDRSGTLRLMIAAMVLGLGATGFAAYSLDSLLLRRRARGSRSQAGSPRTPRRRLTLRSRAQASTDDDGTEEPPPDDTVEAREVIGTAGVGRAT